MKPEAAHEPDFSAAKLELKIIPMIKGVRVPLRVKERTVLSNIDYCSLLGERWEQADVRKKLNHILFVVLEIDPENIEFSKVLRVRLWKPSETDLVLFEQDWKDVQTAVRKAVEFGKDVNPSESIGRILAACRRGRGIRAGGDRVTLAKCGFPNIQGQRRGFALKPSFTRTLVLEWLREADFRSVLEVLRGMGVAPTADEFERRVLEAIAEVRSQSLQGLADRLGVLPSASKSFAASIVRRSLGIPKGEIKEFEEFGITVKTVHAEEEDLMPFEATSFAAMKLKEFAVEDEFETSELFQKIQRILFIVTLSPARTTPQAKRRLAGAFFWTPNDEEIAAMEMEWKLLQTQVRAGGAVYFTAPGKARRQDGLPKESKTMFMHVRPHAADSKDTEIEPTGKSTTKRAFWLNKRLVQRLLLGARNAGKI
jgi:DNA mismatch repair protein MutH